MSSYYNGGARITGVTVIPSSGAISFSKFYGTAKTSGLYSFSTFTFTTTGITGSTGPTLSQCLTAYSASTWTQNSSYFNMDSTYQGIQLWTVPATRSYTITAAGAGNGSGYGSGVVISATFSLTQGDTIRIICGQRGSTNMCGCGGTFVAKGTTTPTSTPLIVAGGCGGGTNSITNATTATNGVSAYYAGGTNGRGGYGGNGGGGGGNAGGGFYTGGSWAADAFVAGGKGFVSLGQGGFGGGGSVTSPAHGGGGGGYSGGGGACDR